MASLSDISNRALRELLGTRSSGVATINLQNGTATFDVVAEPDGLMLCTVGGAAIAYATTANVALAAVAALQNPITGYDGYYTQPAGKTVYYVACVNAAAAVKVVQGTYADQVLGGDKAIGPRGTGLIPDIVVPDSYAPIAVFKVVTAAGTFIPATTFWDSANLTSAGSAPVNVLPKQASDLTFTEGGA
jgi:hypothetical protein